jgi:hypothetical protein
MTTPDNDRMLRKVRALLDLAENAAATEEERNTAMATATEMMAKYGIDQAMANARGQIREEIIARRIDILNPYGYEKASLAAYIGDALNCQVVSHRFGTTYNGVTMIGYQNDVARTEMLYTSLLLQATRQIMDVRPEYSWPTPSETTRYRKNWFMAFAVRVGRRVLAIEIRAARRFEDDHAGAGTALVLADRKTQAQVFRDTLFTDLEAHKRRDRRGDGAREGALAGQVADIGDGKLASADRNRIGG